MPPNEIEFKHNLIKNWEYRENGTKFHFIVLRKNSFEREKHVFIILKTFHEQICLFNLTEIEIKKKKNN